MEPGSWELSMKVPCFMDGWGSDEACLEVAG